jgi:sec-independent protein translocase protein TatA
MDVGLPEILIVLIVVVLLFGPGRLAKLGGELGEGLRSFRQGLEKPGEEKEKTEQNPKED